MVRWFIFEKSMIGVAPWCTFEKIDNDDGPIIFFERIAQWNKFY